jgi:hypothetical protein
MIDLDATHRELSTRYDTVFAAFVLINQGHSEVLITVVNSIIRQRNVTPEKIAHLLVQQFDRIFSHLTRIFFL